MGIHLRTSRRDAMLGGAAGALALTLGSRMTFADQKAVDEELKKLFGDKKAEAGKVTLDVPQIAENGLVVPIAVSVESPMTEASYVKSVHIFANGNPLPGIASFAFTPACGKASASARMRLAQTQDIICIAEMSDGKLYSAKTEVKVTIGGCGG